jgi:hypothetical protein
MGLFRPLPLPPLFHCLVRQLSRGHPQASGDALTFFPFALAVLGEQLICFPDE